MRNLPWRKARKKEVTMTLVELIHRIEENARRQPCISSVVRNDVFRINSIPDLRYGVFAWLQGQHSGSVGSGMDRYSFTLFYVDRLKADEGNQIEVQSVGCSVLGNILRALEEEGIGVEDYTLQPFNQRFTDMCAGVFCNVTLEVPSSWNCGETYDINHDIKVY